MRRLPSSLNSRISILSGLALACCLGSNADVALLLADDQPLSLFSAERDQPAEHSVTPTSAPPAPAPALNPPPAALQEPAPLRTTPAPKPVTPPATAPATLPTTAPGSTAAHPATAGNAAPESTEELQRLKDERFRELRRQLEVLNQLADKPAAGPAESQPGSKPNQSPSSTSPAHGPEGMQKRSGQFEFSKSNQLIPEPLPNEGDLQEVFPIVEGTIDRLALATSLFGTEQVETCLDVLKHTDLTSLPREDQIWAEYMRACCQRRMGNLELAQQSYRKILAEKDADWIGELAAWWLDNLDAKAKLKADAQRLNDTLAAWEKEIDNLATQASRTIADH